MQTLMRSITIGILSLGIVFGVSPVLGSTLTRQEFSGNFILINSPILETFPQSSEYSGFVTYDESNRLLDWAVNVEQLSLALNSNFMTLDRPEINFALFSESDWELKIDFGIAFDAPQYTLARDGTEINFVANLGLAGAAVYSDPASNISVTNTKTSVPEPATVFASLAFLSIIMILKRKLISS